MYRDKSTVASQGDSTLTPKTHIWQPGTFIVVVVVTCEQTVHAWSMNVDPWTKINTFLSVLLNALSKNNLVNCLAEIRLVEIEVSLQRAS